MYIGCILNVYWIYKGTYMGCILDVYWMYIGFIKVPIWNHKGTYMGCIKVPTYINIIYI